MSDGITTLATIKAETATQVTTAHLIDLGILLLDRSLTFMLVIYKLLLIVIILRKNCT